MINKLETTTENTNVIDMVNIPNNWTINDYIHNYNTTGILTTTIDTVYNSPAYLPYFNLFSEVIKIFNIELSQEQEDFLNNLYNTGDEDNKKIASETFKTLINDINRK